MSERPPKIYCGSGKPITHHAFAPGSYSLLVCLDEIPEHTTFVLGGRKMVKLDFLPRREPSAKGMTHAIVVNTYKPDNAHTGASQAGGYTNPSQPTNGGYAPPPPPPPPVPDRYDPQPYPSDAADDDTIDSIPF